MKTILVAEDNPANLELLTEILDGWGYHVVAAATGTEALTELERMRPDLMLVDIQMPELDGFGVLERVRQNPLFRDLPIVALTAQAMRGDREQALAKGFDSYVTKPIDREALQKEVKRFCAE